MKKKVFLLLFALSISFVYAQRSEETTMLEKLNLKSIESVIDEQGKKIDKESKALRINRNEYFKPEANEASEIALSYLQAKKDVYGLNDNLSEIRIVRTVKSPSGEYVYCKQYINDIPVLATNFTIYINKERVVTYALNEYGSHLCQIYSHFQEHGLIATNQIVTTSFTNQTVSTNKIVFSCSDLYAQNVKVQDGAKLTLDAAGTITIDSDFEVELGSELEIK